MCSVSVLKFSFEPHFCALTSFTHKLYHFSTFRLVSILLWLLPDILMFILSITFFVVLKKLTAPVVSEDVEESATTSPNTSPEPATEDEDSYSPEQYVILKRTGTHIFSLIFFFSLKFCMRLNLSMNLLRFNSNILCNGHASVCCNAAAISAKCGVLPRFFVDSHCLGMVQRNRSRFCDSLPNSWCTTDSSHKCAVGVSNTMATRVSRR